MPASGRWQKDTAPRAHHEHYEMGNGAMGYALRPAFIATAILFFSASVASPQPAQTAKPPLNVIQIVSYKKTDAALYDLTVRLEDGATMTLRMNTFVAQDLSRQLGNFNRP